MSAISHTARVANFRLACLRADRIAQELICEEEREKQVVQRRQETRAAASAKEAARRKEAANVRRAAKQRDEVIMLQESQLSAEKQEAVDASARQLVAQRVHDVDAALQQRRDVLEQLQQASLRQAAMLAVAAALRPKERAPTETQPAAVPITLTPRQIATLHAARRLALIHFKQPSSHRNGTVKLYFTTIYIL